ncbi:3-deoxy-D-manno-octulosonic acid transferase [Candidatus Electronema sp. PJ]|uniref:3-deoxy-D-manno-octulosonic acid transferase n=1 Tax=Candidatus Electronema sp. PJ TaxID=3401572 RepID=UPI003AA95DDE
MFLVYNALLAVLILLLLPLILPVILFQKKYRGCTLQRLGFQTQQIKAHLSATQSGPVIWLHALSVGEVTSALPLVKAIRESIRPATLVFTATTRSGKELAEQLMAPHVDLVLFSPLDVPFAIRRYLAVIRPNCFILVETDFWPNWLQQLKRQQVPVMLVNGRISEQSFAFYHRLSFFFQPMFRCFSLLSMQTGQDRDKMLALGIPAEQVVCFGNLKYDLSVSRAVPFDYPAFNGKSIWVCGSTHPGEEELIFAAFKNVGADPRVCPDKEGEHRGSPLHLILAPRKIARGEELVRLAHSFGLSATLRSSGSIEPESPVLILDTIGELASCYGLARLAFIGGSLVDEGGHNPIEAAAQGVPVLFGQHMEDFAEIAHNLTDSGGAKMVTAETLAETAAAILRDDTLHEEMSKAARTLVEQQRGGVERHVQAVRELLGC